MNPSADGVDVLDALRAELSATEFAPASMDESSMPEEAVTWLESRPSDVRSDPGPRCAISRSRASDVSRTTEESSVARLPASQPESVASHGMTIIDTRSGLSMRMDMGEIWVPRARIHGWFAAASA